MPAMLFVAVRHGKSVADMARSYRGITSVAQSPP
jgi:hypothetical protein